MTQYYIIYREGCIGEKGEEKTLLKVSEEGVSMYDRRAKDWMSGKNADRYAINWPDKEEIPESKVNGYIDGFTKRDQSHL